MGSELAVVQAVVGALETATTFPLAAFSDNFTMRSNGKLLNRAGFAALWARNKALMQQAYFKCEEAHGRGGQVGTLRRAVVSAAPGTMPITVTVIDVWHARDGLVVGAAQCWQRQAGPAGDDLPNSAQEGDNLETVRAALAGLQQLGSAHSALARYWSPQYRGMEDGVDADFDSLSRHWRHLQGRLSTLLIDVKEIVAHGSAVGVAFHMLCGKADGGTPAELRVLAVYELAGGQIVSCQAASRLVSGAPGDETLLSVALA